MGRILARCRISCQIAFLGIIGVLGMLSIVAANVWEIQQTVASEAAADAAQAASSADLRLQITMLTIRRHEKNFLMRRQNAYAVELTNALADAERQLHSLQAGAAGDTGLLRPLEHVRAGIAAYASAFNATVAAARTVGLTENDGLLGALRASAHKLEATLAPANADSATVHLLMMRRHEKDFIARLDPKYGAELKARLPAFTAAIAAAALPDETRAQLQSDMADYQDAFARLMAAMLQEHRETEQLGAAYTAMEPNFVTLNDLYTARLRTADEAGAAIAAEARRILLIATPTVIAIVITLCWIIGRNIARPIVMVTRSMEGLARGNLDTPVPEDSRRDEIGTMVHALRGFRDSLRETEHLRAAAAAEREQMTAHKQAALVAMAERIESEAATSVQQIGDRTRRATEIAEEMRGLSRRAGGSAQDASEAATTALANAQAVSSAAEELASSIREISAQVSHSSTVVVAAVDASEQTKTSINALNERVGRIGAVADIIGDIAAKTNLLALNATIEAARAGEAGKGFAVVAGEVKQLASQTAKSTDEITRHIADISAATSTAVVAVERIGSTVGEVNAIATSITAAVEQQRAATAEIARNVAETASAVTAIGARNEVVAQEAAKAERYADDVLENAQGLGKAIDELQMTMNRIVRTSTADVDRRAEPRHAVVRGCRLTLPGQPAQAGHIINLSEHGASVGGVGDAREGQRGTLAVDGVPTAIPCRIVGCNGDAVHLAFDVDAATAKSLAAVAGSTAA
ncbi:MAG: methyl-accepting chemotaxis protein [Acetobacteraceae bacterium]